MAVSGGDGEGAALSGQSLTPRFVRGLEAEPLAASGVVAPVKLREAGLPGLGGHQSPSSQGTITATFRRDNVRKSFISTEVCS